MRAPGKPATLRELLGSAGGELGSSLGLDSLPDLLGERMPELEPNRVGRLRLSKSLEQRFGPQFKSIPGMQNILDEFDKDVKISEIVSLLGGR